MGKTALPKEGPLWCDCGGLGRGQVLIRGEEREARGLEYLRNANYYEGDDWEQRGKSEARGGVGDLGETWGVGCDPKGGFRKGGRRGAWKGP